MPDETPHRPPQAPDDRGHRPGRGGEHSPLQARAAFLENWDWQSVVSVNQRACARSGAQHGANPEAHSESAREWETHRLAEHTLLQTLDFLRACHRGAPFLFFNGNTFSFFGRELVLALFSDLPAVRRREAASAVAHYIAGVLDRESMTAIVEGLCAAAEFAPGDHVRTLRGSLGGIVQRVLDDGRIQWKPPAAPPSPRYPNPSNSWTDHSNSLPLRRSTTCKSGLSDQI